MFGLKVKVAFVCVAAFLIVINCSQAAEYGEDFDDEGNFVDFGKSTLNFDSLENEDAQISQTSVDFKRKHPIGLRRRRIFSERSGTASRRKWGW